jgi:hypothetical protein
MPETQDHTTAGWRAPPQPSWPAVQQTQPVDVVEAVPPPETAAQRAERRKASYELSMHQSEERREMAKAHAEARVGVAPGDDRDAELAKMVAAHSEEKRLLAETQAKARLDSGVDKRGRFVFRGIDLAEKVAVLRADLAVPAAELDFAVSEPRGLDLDVFDPETGLTIAAARAGIPNLGQAAVLMTAPEVVATIVSTRQHQQATR